MSDDSTWQWVSMKPDHDLAAHVDLADAAVFPLRPDDPVVADRDVARDQFAAGEVEDPPALEHEVGPGEPLPLLDRAAEKGDGVAHTSCSSR